MRFPPALVAGAIAAGTAALAAPAHGATLRLLPAAAPAGARITVTGGGFAPQRSVALRLAGRTLARPLADRSGAFAVYVTLPPGLRVRTRPLEARGSRTTLASNVSVLAGPPPVPAPVTVVDDAGTSLRLSRATVAPGGVVALAGAGLPPRSAVTVALSGRARPLRERSTPGGFLRVRLTVPASAAPGDGTVTVRFARRVRRLPLFVLPPGTTPPRLPPSTRPEPLLAAAGDIACRPDQPRDELSCHQGDTAALVAAASPDAVAPLGDLQYDRGAPEEFGAFNASWGPFASRSRPAVGNHEYLTPGAAGYFPYFGAAGGDPSRGFYSYDVGAWHVAVLNSNCTFVPCDAGSEQVRWLRADLLAHPARCTLAYFHHPRFSSAISAGADPALLPFWGALYDAGADVVLSAHAHFYERFAPQDPAGRRDPSLGIREIMVGTGGRSHHGAPTRRLANSEALATDVFGVLLLQLGPRSYGWRFAPEAGATFTDAGRTLCR